MEPRRQPVKNTTEQSTTEPSGSTPPVRQKQSKLEITHLQLKKEKWKYFGHLHMSYQTCWPFLLIESVTNLRLYFQIVR